jgi:Spy/CpxP family protein refolding chaperone
MKTVPKTLFAAVLMTGVAVGAPRVYAQNAHPPKHTWKHHGPAQYFTRLKAQLQITAKQQDAWDTFVKSMKNARPQHAHHAQRHGPGPLKPAPEVLQTRAQRVEDWAQTAKARAQAMKKLYAALTPTQRAIVDTHLADMGHRFRGHFHRR